MSVSLHRQSHVSLSGLGRRQVITPGRVRLARRDFLRGVSAASLAAGTLGLSDLLAVGADSLRQQGKACIILWMQGAPSQFETFSPKPGHENGGETRSISTTVPGVELADRFPELATVMDDVAIIRSMHSKEGNHQRASYLLHTGYAPTASVQYPALGAIATHQIGNAACQLPSFVRIGEREFRNTSGGGILGVDFDPFVLSRGDQEPENTALMTDPQRFERRLALLGNLEAERAARPEVLDHSKLYQKTARMITSPDMQGFDIAAEPESIREAYGPGTFAAGCLLSRRLVEHGVTFIEVGHGGWDTHNDNFSRTTELAGEVDRPFAALLRDLKSRGLLDTTLVVWMGEFGRTPKVNAQAGRDHYPRAFNVAVAGCGVRGGQVIGQTDPGGTEITDRPVSVQDLFQTFCHALGIDAWEENLSPIGRPIRVVDGGEPVMELFG